MVHPGFKRFKRSPFSIINNAARSLMLPPGFKCSHLTRIVDPMQDLLPTRVLRHLVDVLSNSDFSPEAEIGDILSEVENTKLLYPTTSGWTVLVTGHSLGADIALVLGARAKIPYPFALATNANPTPVLPPVPS